MAVMPGNSRMRGGDAVGEFGGLVDAEAAGVAAMVLDAFKELVGELLAHAGELEELALAGGGFELVDVGDLEGGPEEGDGLGAHAGEAEELEHGGAVAGEELITQGHGAGGDEVADALRHALADVGDGEQGLGIGVGHGEGCELGGLGLDGFGGATVGADTEGVGAVDLEEGSGFIEKAGDGDVVHAAAGEMQGLRQARLGYPPHPCTGGTMINKRRGLGLVAKAGTGDAGRFETGATRSSEVIVAERGWEVRHPSSGSVEDAGLMERRGDYRARAVGKERRPRSMPTTRTRCS